MNGIGVPLPLPFHSDSPGHRLSASTLVQKRCNYCNVLREIRARMEGQATEWEVRGDLLLLRQLGLAESAGWGRGAFWRLLRK